MSPMLHAFRLMLVLYGIVAAVTGGRAATASYDAEGSSPMQDSNHRFIAAVWASTALAFFYTAWNPSEVALFRFLMVAVFIGGLLRAYGLRFYAASSFVVMGILIELVPTALLFWMHTKLLNADSL